MKIRKDKTKYSKYAFESQYDSNIVVFCQFLKQSFGWKEFSWDSDKKVWRFNDLTLAILLSNKFPLIDISEIQEDITTHMINTNKETIRKQKTEQIKKAKEASIQVKNIKGELYEYQKIGVEFFLNSGGRALLADSPGVGKTAQTLAYIAHSGFKRNLIVCPASVKFSWANEINKWTYMKSFVVESKTKLEDIPHDVQCIIINFDILKKFHNEFKKYYWDSLVVDECHLIKTQSAIRSKVVKSIALDIPNIVMLTGTPVLSRPIELFNMLSIIDPNTWNNYYQYATKYCGGRQGYWGFEAKGATNLEELSQKISKYFLRRTKENVLKELPEKNRINIPIDLPDEERKEYDLVERNLVQYLKHQKSKTKKEIKKAMQAEKLVKLNLLREINTRGKLKTALEIINSILESGEKVLVFSSFNNPLKELNEIFPDKSVMLLGSTKTEDREQMVKDFQNKPEIQIFLGGMQSAGVGITLTAASNVIFLDYPWNPADLEQAENRAHRPGAYYQSLNIYQITSRNSIDEFMRSLLKKKQEIIDKTIDAKVEKQDASKPINDYIKELELKYK